MIREKQIEIITAINEKSLTLMKSKGHDYAGVDVLKNFKQMQQLMEILEVDVRKIEGVHMFYILLKIQRLCNLLFSGKLAKNEAVEDTFIDLRNYVDLMNLTYHEKSELQDSGSIIKTKPGKKYITWKQVEELVDNIAFQIKGDIKGIHGIARGGLIPAVMLSHKTGLPLTTNSYHNNKILIVDEICDTGKTLIDFKNTNPTAVLFCKSSVQDIPSIIGKIYEPEEGWLVFPWETK